MPHLERLLEAVRSVGHPAALHERKGLFHGGVPSEARLHPALAKRLTQEGGCSLPALPPPPPRLAPLGLDELAEEVVALAHCGHRLREGVRVSG